MSKNEYFQKIFLDQIGKKSPKIIGLEVHTKILLTLKWPVNGYPIHTAFSCVIAIWPNIQVKASVFDPKDFVQASDPIPFLSNFIQQKCRLNKINAKKKLEKKICSMPLNSNSTIFCSTALQATTHFNSTYQPLINKMKQTAYRFHSKIK